MTVAASYLKTHMARIHGICVPQTRGVNGVGVGPSTYVVSFPRLLKEVKCLVPGCLEVAHSAVRLHKFFIYLHFRSKAAVFQEGTEPLPHCDFCGMHMPAYRIENQKQTYRCNRETVMRLQWRDLELVQMSREMDIIINGREGDELV